MQWVIVKCLLRETNASNADAAADWTVAEPVIQEWRVLALDKTTGMEVFLNYEINGYQCVSVDVHLTKEYIYSTREDAEKAAFCKNLVGV